jgi:hypothetical protein
MMDDPGKRKFSILLIKRLWDTEEVVEAFQNVLK